MFHSQMLCDLVYSKMRIYGMRHNMNLSATYAYVTKYDTFKHKLIMGKTRKFDENGFADSISPFKVNF